eukprot:COSAG03_NODE_6129_length_1110_cov_11.556874_1_plen_158_part_10
MWLSRDGGRAAGYVEDIIITRTRRPRAATSTRRRRGRENLSLGVRPRSSVERAPAHSLYVPGAGDSDTSRASPSSCVDTMPPPHRRRVAQLATVLSQGPAAGGRPCTSAKEKELVEAFLSADSFAVVGASRNRSKFGNKILRCCEPSSVCSCVPARYA